MLVAWIRVVMVKIEKSEFNIYLLLRDEVTSHMRAIKKSIEGKIKGGFMGMMAFRAGWYNVIPGPEPGSMLGS